ncbi:hypothetical protein I9E57_005322, partial [Salmonella enterica]|nr:hypothetical protein [Salmonella enterica]
DMKMDKEEVKREYKEQEGNPEFKSRRLEMHREILSEQIKSDISNSRLIIVNPTHIAIGIYFKPEISLIPVISFKAANAYALAVRKYAEKVKIPVIRDVKLARRIYATHKCYDYICLEELDAIFELLLWLEDVEKARVSVTCQVTGNMDDDSEILTAEIVDEEIIMNGTDSSDSSNKDY